MRKVMIAGVAVLLPASAQAHPGHGAIDSDSVLHYVASPQHLGWVAALVLPGLAVLLMRAVKRVRRQKAAQAVRSDRIS